MLSLRGPEFEDKVAREGKLPPIIQVMERGRGSSNPSYRLWNEGGEAPSITQVMERGEGGAPTHHAG